MESDSDLCQSEKTLETTKKTFKVIYLGSSSMDRRYTQCVQPWVMAEIRRKTDGFREVTLDVLTHTLRATTCGTRETDVLFEHKLQELTRFAKLHQEPRCFAYLSRQQLNNDDFECHVFLAHEELLVPEIFTTIREATKDLNKDREQVVNLPSNMGEGTFDQTKTFFEVMLIGRTRVNMRKVPTSFIDELVDKIDAKEEEKKIKAQEQRQRHASGASVRSLPASLEDTVSVMENNLEMQHEQLHSNFHCDSTESSTDELGSCADTYESSTENIIDHSSCLSHSGNIRDLKVEFSVDSDSSKEQLNSDEHDKEVFCDNESGPKEESSRIMLLQIGRKDLNLINLDKKQVILERKFKDISFVSQGSTKQDVFGIISREPLRDAGCPVRDQGKPEGSVFICYILRCHSESVVSDIMCTLQNAFTLAYKQNMANKQGPLRPQSQNQICIMCPLHQLEKLCQEINGLSPHAAHDLLMRRIHHLPEAESAEIAKRLKLENPQSHDEMVEVMMIGLRRLCERKQKEHIHISDGAKNCKNEFNILDDRNLPRKFDAFKNKAKKSLANSFESLLRGRKKEDAREAFRQRSGTADSDSSWTRSVDSSACSTPDISPVSSPVSKEFRHQFPSPPASPETPRKRSSTVGAIPDPAISASRRNMTQRRQRDVNHNSTRQTNNLSPMKNMFLLVGSPGLQFADSSESSMCPSPIEELTPPLTPKRRASWRQAIFNRVVTPVQTPDADLESESFDSCDGKEPRPELTPLKLRCLWKKAILETLLLIRMEKENQNLRARQDEMEQRRKKMDYLEVTPCLKEVTKVWEEMLMAPDRKERKIPTKTLYECVEKGIPRSLRGDIWKFLVEQHNLQTPGLPGSVIQTPYTDLLKQLTTHQHAILIDLGRTFPGHPYFSVQLGPGQLELFNLLKAYSLLDQEVGYCQGLSFIVGILLMHMEETTAFETLQFIMFKLGLRKQYRPNMMALQIKLYQLTRLIHDHHRDLYDHFENHEISPTLYAAPWFLTLFASQFPLGFVARVFDLIFIQGIDAIFKIALALLSNHRELILQCDSFESVVEFLKNTLPDMVHVQMERIINQAFDMDISKQVQSYEVEYHVLREEMMYSPQRGEVDLIHKLESANRSLKQQNMDLLEKLQQTHSHQHSLELAVHSHQVNEGKLKSHICTLELERSALLNAVAKLRQLVSKEEIDKLDLSLPTFAPSLPVSPVHGGPNHRLSDLNLSTNQLSANQLSAEQNNTRLTRNNSDGNTQSNNKEKINVLSKHNSH